jgi:hypothetical protein
MTANHRGCTSAATTNFTFDRFQLARTLKVADHPTSWGLGAFGDSPAQQIAGAVTCAQESRTITEPDGVHLQVYAIDGSRIAIALCDRPPAPTQHQVRAAAGLPRYRHVGTSRHWTDLKPAAKRGTFTGTCEAIEHVLLAADDLTPAVGALLLGEARWISLHAEPLRVLAYNSRGRLATHTTSVSHLAQDAPTLVDLWPLLIEALDTGEATEDWDGDQQRTLLLRSGGETHLARQLNAARARLVHAGGAADGVLPDPHGGLGRYLGDDEHCDLDALFGGGPDLETREGVELALGHATPANRL